MAQAFSERILVISDIHFGEGDALLTVRDASDAEGKARVDGLVEWLSDHQPFKEIILLGDIWELWTATFAEARVLSDYFLSRLATLDFERMLFLPGNHDHHLLVQHQVVEQILAMRDDRDLEVPERTQRRFEDSHLAQLLPLEARDRFVVSYPDHFATVGDKHIVFHHGHHTAILHGGRSVFSSGPLFILQRMEEIGLHEITRSDLELAGTIIFELLYAVSLGTRTRAKMNDLWDRFLTVKRYLAALSFSILHPIQRWISRTERGTLAQDVESYDAAVHRILALAEQEHGQPLPCDAYVFGHTHRAGIVHSVDISGRPRLLANSGTWLHEPAKANTASEGTFLIIDPAHVALYRQGDDLSIRPLDIERWPEPEAEQLTSGFPLGKGDKVSR
ncbi:MAG: metallophosphoesterase [Chloroflexota bacterium]|nr:metallophosphoesterase [Chloroflexota bacterium]